MKKKPVVILLMIAAILIWGMVAWRIISGLNGGNKMVSRQIAPKQMAVNEAVFADSFEIKANYPDPFLGGWPANPSRQTKSVVKQVKKEEKKPEKPPEPEINWSFIVYKGLIKNKDGKKIGLAHIKGRDYMINEGIKIEEVEIKKIFEDSVLVSFSNKLKYILSK